MLCGCVATVLALKGDLFTAALLIPLAAVFDLLDGLVARALKATSAIGEQLDSLADMVTFGVAPGMLVYFMLSKVADGPEWLPYLAFIIPLCSALRLARFNAVNEESNTFLGLATPANALFWALLIIVAHWKDGLPDGNANGFHFKTIMADMGFLLATSITLSLLMVSRIPMFSFKLKDLSWKSNRSLYVFLVLSALSLVLFQAVGLVLIIPLYILISVAGHLFNKKNEIQS